MAQQDQGRRLYFYLTQFYFIIIFIFNGFLLESQVLAWDTRRPTEADEDTIRFWFFFGCRCPRVANANFDTGGRQYIGSHTDATDDTR